MRRRVVKAVRVAPTTSSVSPFGRSTFSPAGSVGASQPMAARSPLETRTPTFGEGKGVVDTPRTVKPGEKIVVKAMRYEELKRLAGQKFTVYKGGRGSGVLAAHRVMIHAQQKQLDDMKETLKKRDAEIENLKYVIYLKNEQIEAQQTTPRLILEAKEKEIEQLKAALENKLIPLTVQKMPWHLFEKDPPQSRQLIAMAEYSQISRRWTYWATKLERDQIAFWKQVDSDVRWAPLPELLVGDEEPEVLP